MEIGQFPVPLVDQIANIIIAFWVIVLFLYFSAYICVCTDKYRKFENTLYKASKVVVVLYVASFMTLILIK